MQVCAEMHICEWCVYIYAFALIWVAGVYTEWHLLLTKEGQRWGRPNCPSSFPQLILALPRNNSLSKPKSPSRNLFLQCLRRQRFQETWIAFPQIFPSKKDILGLWGKVLPLYALPGLKMLLSMDKPGEDEDQAPWLRHFVWLQWVF